MSVGPPVRNCRSEEERMRAAPTVGAALLALANSAVGVLVHQVLLAFVRRVRGHPRTQVEATR